MNRVSRGLLRGASAVVVACAVGVGGPGATCSADPVLFDPDGSGSANGAITIAGLDWSAGNVVAIGANQAVTNFQNGSGSTTFEVDYQAILAGPINASGDTIHIPGLNASDGFQITVAARFFETVADVSVAGSTATASFTQAANQTGGFFEIYYDNNPNTVANNLTGTGFRDGTKILSASAAGATGNFTVENTDPSAATAFDQFQGNDYGSLLTVPGHGGSDASFLVDPSSVDKSFFQSVIGKVAFNTTNSLPFDRTDPSQQFLGYTPKLGSVNGSQTSDGGPDIQFQADGNNSFAAAVPEPSSVLLVALGVAGVLGYDQRRRRRPQVG